MPRGAAMSASALATMIRVGPTAVIGAAAAAGIIGVWLTRIGLRGSNTPWVQAVASVLGASSLLHAAGSRFLGRASVPQAPAADSRHRTGSRNLLSDRTAAAVNCALDAAVPLLLVAMAIAATHT